MAGGKTGLGARELLLNWAFRCETGRPRRPRGRRARGTGPAGKLIGSPAALQVGALAWNASNVINRLEGARPSDAPPEQARSRDGSQASPDAACLKDGRSNPDAASACRAATSHGNGSPAVARAGRSRSSQKFRPRADTGKFQTYVEARRAATRIGAPHDLSPYIAMR